LPTRRFVAWTLRHGRLLWGLALLLALPAALRTTHLYGNLRSEIEELLPRDAPSVVAIDELRRRMAGLQYLGVVVDVGSADRLPAGERFLDDLAARIRKYPAGMVSGVSTGFQNERDFVAKHAALLLDLPDLETVRGRIEDRVHWEYGQKTGTLLDDEGPPSVDFSDIEHKYQSRFGESDLVGQRFSSEKKALTLLLVEVGGFSTSATRAAELIGRVESDIAALGGPGHYAPGLRVGFAGDVAVSAEEMSALVQDLTVSSALVLVMVALAITLFYRWTRAVPALFLPLGVALVWTFALASLPPFHINELNSNTAFLGSIIVGNGINFGIIQLARYVEARRRGETVEGALTLSLWGTRKGTLSAALAAGVAYASLVAMQFRGFRQFGVIGGIGMLLCWGATFLLGPPLIAWLDGGRIAVDPPETRRLRPMHALARWVGAHPRIIAGVAALMTVLAAFEVRGFGRDQLEFDFSRLRRRDTWASGEGYWGKKMDALLGRYLTPTVILTDSQEEARAVTARLKQAASQGPMGSLIAGIRTFDDLLPPNQEAKAAVVEAIRRKLTPNVRKHMSDVDRNRLDDLLGTGPPPSIVEDEIPAVLAAGLRERDGSTGRAVLVFPNPNNSWWRGDTVTAFVGGLRDVAAAPVAMGGRAARVAGGPALSADIITSMERDGPLASLLAFVGVVATVLIIFRWGLATPFVIGSLVVGVLWLLAATMLLKIKVNFINFIAFPITFGIGVDYSVNVMARYLRDGGRDVRAAIRGTGGAVGLASLTTIIGYSSLLVAQNVGLFLFGLLAVLGEIACLTTAVVVLPAVLMLLRPGTAAATPPFEWDLPTSAQPPAEQKATAPRASAGHQAQQ
jgi:predicted RND superfamily exporter protein